MLKLTPMLVQLQRAAYSRAGRKDPCGRSQTYKQTNDGPTSQTWMQNVTKILQQGDKTFVFHLNHKLPEIKRKCFKGPSKMSPSTFFCFIKFFILSIIFTFWQVFLMTCDKFWFSKLYSFSVKNQQSISKSRFSDAQTYITTYNLFYFFVLVWVEVQTKKNM